MTGGVMKRCLVLGWLILTASLVGHAFRLESQVEHSPTVAQCQADQRLWLSKLETLPADTGLPSYTSLSLWAIEMDNCQQVDPKNQWLYYNVHGEISDVQASRMVRFVGRHGLWNKFLAEDAAGKR
jgi:hypothetical protein